MEQENFIPLIHNYCDRWCERCAFTARCVVFAEQNQLSDEEKDPDSPAFWEHLQQKFKDAIDQLHEMMERLDIPIEDPEAQEGETPEESPEQKALEAQAHNLASAYADSVEAFFKNNEAFFEQQSDEQTQRHNMGLPIDLEALGFAREAVETIRWYQHFIEAKTLRALSGLTDLDDWEDPLQSDGNGSAKVAVLAVQRSSDAWAVLGREFADKRAEVAAIQAQLDAVKQLIEQYFPQWQAFHRPGFDDEPNSVVRLDFNPN